MDRKKVVLVAPFLRKTLTRIVRNATFEIDQVECPHVVTKVGGRTSQVEIDCQSTSPKACRMFHPRLPALGPLRINPCETRRFSGLNALVAVSKNNRLEWIQDWLKFHVALHGANSVVLFDNGSDRYRFRKLLRTIASVPGITEYAVLSAPFPFGPNGATRIHHNARYFQLSMLHLAQSRFLRSANAVLSIDIDELVLPQNGLSVFDAVRSASQGFVSITGSWVYAREPADGGFVLHKDHKYRRRRRDRTMSPKWCVDPMGPLRGKYWRLHGIADATRDHSQGFRFLHCRQITTNWDYARNFESAGNLEESPDASIIQSILE